MCIDNRARVGLQQDSRPKVSIDVAAHRLALRRETTVNQNRAVTVE